MKILLVLPAADHLRVNPGERDVPKRNMLRFSILPLTMVAALTPEKHEVTLCDENVTALDFDADVDVVGITFMTALANRAYEIAEKFRARGKVVVGGGFHPTLWTDEATRHFDSIVAGDAEGSWPRLLDDVEAGCLQRVYRSSPCGDLSHTPIPRRDLTEATAKYYVTTHAVQTGRGCSHGCRYCSVTAFHQKTHRSRPLENVLDELRQIPTRNFMFVDDNIIADPDYARRLFRAMAPMRKQWVSQCSIEIADDPELLRLARKAGCRGLFVGIETVSEKNLSEVGKGFNQSGRYGERIAKIRKQGIGIIAGMIVGMDHDDTSTFAHTLQFLKDMNLDAIQLNIMTPLPGTPLYDDMEKRGRIIDKDWSHYDFRHCVIQPARMSAEELQEGADWLLSQFYRLDRIFLRFAKGLFTVGWLPSLLNLKLNLTYRYDVKRNGIRGRNPNVTKTRGHVLEALRQGRAQTLAWLRKAA